MFSISQTKGELALPRGVKTSVERRMKKIATPRFYRDDSDRYQPRRLLTLDDDDRLISDEPLTEETAQTLWTPHYLRLDESGHVRQR